MGNTDEKPLGMKAYGHIGHLPGSRIGSGDHKVIDGSVGAMLLSELKGLVENPEALDK